MCNFLVPGTPSYLQHLVSRLCSSSALVFRSFPSVLIGSLLYCNSFYFILGIYFVSSIKVNSFAGRVYVLMKSRAVHLSERPFASSLTLLTLLLLAGLFTKNTLYPNE